jgi:hypothetical protein
MIIHYQGKTKENSNEITNNSLVFKNKGLELADRATFCSYVRPSAELGHLLIDAKTIHPQHVKTLWGLLLTTQLYNKLEGATIPLSILSKSLGSGLWIPPEVGSLSDFDVENQKALQRAPRDDPNLSTSDELNSDTSSTSVAWESGAEDEKGLTRESRGDLVMYSDV